MLKFIKLNTLIGLICSNYALATDTRIDNIKLYQSELETFSEPSRVYITDGKIEKITPLSTLPTKALQVIDARNQFAVPGLIDLHVHLAASGSNYGEEFQILPVSSHFNSNLYLGITSVVDLFAFDITLQEAKSLENSQITPNLFYAGVLFTNPGGHGTQFGGKALEIHQDSDIEELWQQHIARNPHVTKAVIETFGGHGASLTDSQLAELGKRSRKAGLPYFVHVSTLQDGKRAIRAGATALAHGINAELVDDEFINLMVQHKVAYIPTLAVMHNHNAEKQTQAISKQTKLLKTVSEKLKHCLFDNVPEPSKWRDAVWQKKDNAFSNIQKLKQAGVLIGAGSDAGNPYTLHGVALHNEIQALIASGLSPAESLNAATINGARILKKHSEIGQLKPEFEASFLLTKNNPLTDIGALQNITQVYKSGERIDRQSLINNNQKFAPFGAACNKKIASSSPLNKLIDDFKGELKWQAINDSMMGGASTTQLAHKNNELIIDTHLGKPTGFGAWAGTQLMFDSAVDASDYQGIKIKYKGSQVPFGVSIYHSEVKDWDHFYTNLKPSKQRQVVEIPFTELKQFGFGNKVNWSAKSISGISLVWRSDTQGTDTYNKNRIELGEITYF